MASIDSNVDHDYWQHHIAQWQASGLSQASYCRQQALRTHQFSYWKCKFLAGSEPVASEPKTGFTRVQVATHVATPSAPGLSLCFRDGIQVTGIAQDNMALIKQLIELLR
ncbi:MULTISPECIES: IS66 family insertion sequence element accessory protein TnpA [Methylobacter]